jgi:TP901-1 family phage major tail protein
MAKSGRDLTFTWDSVALAGVQTKGYTVSNTYVDVTTDDEDGWRTLLADPGLRAVEATVGGITKNQVLLAEVMKASITGEPLLIDLPTTTGTLAGTFLCSSYEETGEHDGAVKFTATFMSSGAVTYTAGT